MNNAELRSVMIKYGACKESFTYVLSCLVDIDTYGNSLGDDAGYIMEKCDRRPWLIWLLSRELVLDSFIAQCALRTKEAEKESLSYFSHVNLLRADGHPAHRVAVFRTAYNTAIFATFLPTASEAEGERARQLVELKSIGLAWGRR